MLSHCDLKVWDGSAEMGTDGGAEPAVVVVGRDVNLEKDTFSNIPKRTIKYV